MIIRFLVAIAIFAASPAFVFSQDIFFLLGQGGDATNTATVTTADGSGSVYMYSANGFDFDAIEIGYSSSDSSVIEITGGELFNPTFTNGFGITGARWVDGSGIFGPETDFPNSLFALHFGNLTGTFGINSNFSMFDPDFDPSVGADGAFLVARVDFDIVGEGTATLDMNFRAQDPPALILPDINLFPTFGSATVTVGSDVLLGDVNIDGEVNFFDIPQFVVVLFSGAFQAEADINQDNDVDFFDVVPFIGILLGF